MVAVRKTFDRADRRSSAVLFGIDAVFVTSRALSVAFLLAGAVFVFGALMALLTGGPR